MKLPNEVVIRIMTFTYVQDVETFTSCLQTCRKWRQLGRSLPWKDLRVTEDNAWTIINALASATPEDLEAVRSITTSLDQEHDDDASRQLPLLYARFHKMTNLESVSSFDNLRGSTTNPTHAYMTYNQCLICLPVSVRFLELGGWGVNETATSGHWHPCADIRNVLPQLRQLRLQACTICKTLLQVKTTCSELQEIHITGPTDFMADTCESGDNTGVQDFIDIARARIKAGCFPKLTKFNIYDCRYKERTDSQLAFSCVYCIDVLRNNTTTYPLAQLEDDTEWIRYTMRDAIASVNLLGVDISMSGARRSGVVEGPTWARSKLGIRLPPQLQKSRDYHQWDSLPDLALFKYNYDEYRIARELPLPLWYWEEQAGASLIGVETTKGARPPDLPLRVQCEEELNFMQMRAEYKKIERQWLHRWHA